MMRSLGPDSKQTAFTSAKDGPMWSPDKVGGFTGVKMEDDDAFKTHERLSKLGIEFTEPARTEPWGGWAMFKDSEGNVLGMHSTASASRN